jgi:hypothetical protein
LIKEGNLLFPTMVDVGTELEISYIVINEHDRYFCLKVNVDEIVVEYAK